MGVLPLVGDLYPGPLDRSNMVPSMTLDELLAECTSSGWSLSLFQAPNGWTADIRQWLPTGNIFKGYAFRPTLSEAIRSALDEAKEHDMTTTKEGWKAFVKPDRRSNELLVELGLLPAQQPVRRI